MVITRLGDSALILKCEEEGDTLQKILGWKEGIKTARLDGVYECLPCYQTLTVFYDRNYWSFEALSETLTNLLRQAVSVRFIEQKLHQIPVCYEGEYAPDMELLSNHTGLSESEIISRHSSERYLVAGLGFSPGFGFLQGLPIELNCPRREMPRLVVPKGSVGVANNQTGIYPNETAGGWNLIGQSPVQLVDLDSEKPSLLQVGDQVQFIPISEPEFRKERSLVVMRPLAAPQCAAQHVRVLRVGGMTTLQDLGRVNYRDQGFPSGGAMDRRMVQLLNQALGNAPNDSVVEFYRVGVKVEFSASAYVMVGGDVLPTINALQRSPWSVLEVQQGDVLDCGVLQAGSWGYLAIQGGFDVSLLCGSGSTHPHLKLGGHRGRCLEVGDQVSFHPSSGVLTDGAGVVQEDRVFSRRNVIRCMQGGQWDWFSEREQKKFFESVYTVSEKSNRVGCFLEGATFAKVDENRELTSEGACSGTIQITNSGQPVVLMPDSQSIGGYPKIAHILEEDLSRFVQLRPGEVFQFQPVSEDEFLS